MVAKETFLGREGSVSQVLMACLKTKASAHGLELEFTEQPNPETFMRRIQGNSKDVIFEGNCRLRVWMVVGHRGLGVGIGGGYILEYYPGRSETTYCTILGGSNDYNRRAQNGVFGQKPVYIFREEGVSVRVTQDWKTEHGILSRPEDLPQQAVLETKMAEVFGYIAGHLSRGWDPLRDDPLWSPVRPLVRPRPVPVARENVMRFGPVRSPETGPLQGLSTNSRVVDVVNLKEELRAALRGSEAVEIEGLPVEISSNVEVLLGGGAIELKRLGIELPKMSFGGVYEGKMERVYGAVSGNRVEDGEVVVQVIENRVTRKLNLVVGLILTQGEGRNERTVSAMLNYENEYPVILGASRVELAASCDGQTIRRDYSAGNGHYMGTAGGRPGSKAANCLTEYFPGDSYQFEPAFRALREKTRRTFGWLGK